MTSRRTYVLVGIVAGAILASALGWAAAGGPGAPSWMRTMPMDRASGTHMQGGPMASDHMGGPMSGMNGAHHGAGGTAAAPAGTDVAIRGSAFEPRELRVRVGDTVRWTNLDAYAHTVTSDDGAFESDLLAEGDSFETTFTQAGVYTYHCEPHSYQDARGEWQGQTGTIIVE